MYEGPLQSVEVWLYVNLRFNIQYNDAGRVQIFFSFMQENLIRQLIFATGSSHNNQQVASF